MGGQKINSDLRVELRLVYYSGSPNGSDSVDTGNFHCSEFPGLDGALALCALTFHFHSVPTLHQALIPFCNRVQMVDIVEL